MTNPKANRVEVDWYGVDQEFNGLKTGDEHIIEVKREAIPIIFLPGIMGSVLRLSGTDGDGTGENGLPNLRWDPGSDRFMFNNYSGASGAQRRRMMVGDSFSSDFLEVHNSDPVGNGFQGVSVSSYHGYLNFLQEPGRFGPLDKIFDFPVYAFGYNWTDTNANSGTELMTRIDEIIDEASEVTGHCEKVILVTHSMGGLVGRYASELAGARSKVLGVIHAVQPVAGAGAAYWRVKAGFEGFASLGIVSSVLGNSGRTVTPMLGNLPGGLELLPNKAYQGDDGKQWLRITEDDNLILSLPIADPYNEIYRIPATGNEVENPGRKYWGLVDPDLLDPGNNVADGLNEADLLSDEINPTPWEFYLNYLQKAESFHEELEGKFHPKTYTMHGTGSDTAASIKMEVETVWVERDSYVTRGFRSRFNNSEGEERRAWLQDPDGDGDGTVSTFSSSLLDSKALRPPAPLGLEIEHEPAYNNDEAREFSVNAIIAICKSYYEDKRG